MAVAETSKVEKRESSGAASPAWLSGAVGWAPRKIQELRSFFIEVRGELKKVTWPGKQEVYSTTIVLFNWTSGQT